LIIENNLCILYSGAAVEVEAEVEADEAAKVAVTAEAEITEALLLEGQTTELLSLVSIDDRISLIRRKLITIMMCASGLPPTGSWQDLKDHMREAGDVCYADTYKDGTGMVEFLRYEDMKYAIKKLDDSRFRSHEVSYKI